MDKSFWRKKYLERRSLLSSEVVEELSLQIANHALKLPIWDKTTYHIFLSMSEQKEVDTEYLLHILQGKDKSIVIPRVNFKTSSLEHVLLQENTVLNKSKYGISEPVSGIEVPPNSIDVVFVPLLAYDVRGNRIGYGKGFYDRFLSKCKSDALFVGLSFFEAEELIPASPEDVPLTYVITPSKIYSFLKK